MISLAAIGIAALAADEVKVAREFRLRLAEERRPKAYAINVFWHWHTQRRAGGRKDVHRQGHAVRAVAGLDSAGIPRRPRHPY